MSKDQKRAADNPTVSGGGAESKRRHRVQSMPKAARRGSITSSAQSGVRAASPEETRWIRFWSRWKAADYEGRIAMFTEALSDEERMVDPDEAWEPLSDLYAQTIEHGQRDRFDGLIAGLREHRPEAYAQDEPRYLQWRMTNAIALGRTEDIAPIAREMGQSGSKAAEVFFRMIDHLMYHGRISELIDMLRTARTWVSDGGDLVPWAIDEFNDTACQVELLDYIQQETSVRPDDPGLLERLRLYVDHDPQLVGEHLDRLTGASNSHWTFTDFLTDGGSAGEETFDDFDDVEDDDYEPIAHNVWCLAEEFAGHAARCEGVAPTRAEIARHEIGRYIRARHNGDLDDRRSMFEKMSDPRKKIPAAVDSADYHVLCPDRDTLDCFLAGSLNFMNPQPYRAAAFFELIPPWLAFLESGGLLSAERRRQAMEELTPLASSLSPVIERYTKDPAAAEGVMRYWAVDCTD